MPYLFAVLMTVMKWTLGSFIARILTGAGMAVATYAVLTPLILSALELAAQSLQSDILVLARIAGVGDALSIIGSAMLTRISLVAGAVYVVRSQRAS